MSMLTSNLLRKQSMLTCLRYARVGKRMMKHKTLLRFVEKIKPEKNSCSSLSVTHLDDYRLNGATVGARVNLRRWGTPLRHKHGKGACLQIRFVIHGRAVRLESAPRDIRNLGEDGRAHVQGLHEKLPCRAPPH